MDPRLTLVTLGVADLDRSIAFYRDVLGWTPASTSDSWPMRDDGRIDLPAG